MANLPLDVKVEAVNSMFAKFGAVDEVHLIRDHRGDFKGCAFVRYRSKSDAVTAIQRLNESKNLKGATESDRSFRRRLSVYLPNVQRQRIDAEW